MDHRTKFILLIIGSVILFGAVVWFIIIPTLQPLFPAKITPQPSALPGAITPSKIKPATTPSTPTQPSAGGAGGVVTFEPVASPERALILDLSQRAGIAGVRAESGSSANVFSNYDDASLNASPAFAAKLAALKKDMQKKHPPTGKLYLTVARLLVSKPESDTVISGTEFSVAAQMQVQVTDDTKVTTEYREATVTFVKSGSDWVASGYSVKLFTP
jgi:hypothetical protein